MHHLGVHVGRDHRRRRVRTHAAGVGALVVVTQALVVLAGGERDDVLAVAQHDEARFLAFEELLDDDPRAAGVVLHAELVVEQHPVDSFARLRQGHRHHHALAGGQSVGLDDDRCALLLDVGMRRFRVGEGLVGCGRDLVPMHEGLGEGLGAFELRGRLRRAEDAQAALAEQVDHAGGQRRLRADHRQHDLFLHDEVGQRPEVGDRHVVQALVHRRAAVAGRDVDRLDLG